MCSRTGFSFRNLSFVPFGALAGVRPARLAHFGPMASLPIITKGMVGRPHMAHIGLIASAPQMGSLMRLRYDGTFRA